MEKYYDLIVSMIKSHRKYPGCESIIDDIVSDVYSHAEVVLNTVTNESVITSYLNKIVATSMITVPKSLGIDNHRKQEYRSISEPEITRISNVTEVPSVAVSVNEDVEPEEAETDEFANNTDELSLSVEDLSDNEDETDELTDATEELSQETEDLSDNEDETDELTDTMEELSQETEDLSNSEDETDELTDTTEELPQETEDLSNSEDETDELTDATEELPQETEDLSNSEDETDELTDTTEELPQETEDLLNNEDDQANLDELEENSVPDVDKTLVDKMINGVPEENQLLENNIDDIDDLTVDDISSDEQKDIDAELDELTVVETEEQKEPVSDELIEQADDIEPLACEEPDELELTDEISEPETSELSSLNDEGEEETEFALPSYDCFEYEPDDEEPERESILADDLKSLQSNDANDTVMNVCKLKYKEHYSVDKIAETLGLNQTDVLDILDKVIDLVEG